MRRSLVLLGFLALFAISCGPSATELREQTLSILNTEADRWNGGDKFATSATDAYGHPLTGNVQKTTLDYVLEIRSNGPDGLPKNSDDVVITRSKRHGETSITKEATKVVESLSSGATSGMIKGIRKELGMRGRVEKE